MFPVAAGHGRLSGGPPEIWAAEDREHAEAVARAFAAVRPGILLERPDDRPEFRAESAASCPSDAQAGRRPSALVEEGWVTTHERELRVTILTGDAFRGKIGHLLSR